MDIRRDGFLEEPSLGLDDFQGGGAFLVIVGHVIDASADGLGQWSPNSEERRLTNTRRCERALKSHKSSISSPSQACSGTRNGSLCILNSGGWGYILAYSLEDVLDLTA